VPDRPDGASRSSRSKLNIRPDGPLTAARLARVQNGLWQNSPAWQIMVGRQFALAIPMARLQLP